MIRTLLDCIVAGFCPACDQECGLVQASPDSLRLACGHTLPFPLAEPVALRAKTDGTAVLYTDLDDMRRVQRREGKRVDGMTVLEDFRHAIEQSGLTPPDSIIPDGKLHRFASNGDPEDKAGWYVLHSDGIPAGAFGCWRAGHTETWCSKSDPQMTEAERHECHRRHEAAKRQRETEEHQRHADAAIRARTLWDEAPLAHNGHPYLQKKRVQPHDIKIDDNDRLLIATMINGVITSLQFIYGDGDKKFLPGGEVKGGSYTIGDLTGAATVLICEGFATAASLYEATGHPTVMAFNAGNLFSVAQALRQQFPAAVLVLCADNDIRQDGTPNTGVEAATAAAKAIKGIVAIPEVINDAKTDWNDVHVDCGLAAVNAKIAAVLTREAARARIALVDDECDLAPFDDLGDFPEEAWRGPFKPYREAMQGTSEAPDTAHFTALWAIAAATLRRRVSFYYAFPHFANVYLVNFGNTGDSKTSAGRQGLRLLPEQGVKLLRGVGSAEALGDWMQQPEDGPAVSHLLFIEELATLLTRGGWEGSTLLSFLTETFDAPDKYEILFRKNPVLVQEPTPTLMAGTTIEWLWKGLREIDVHGGFGNRIFYLTGAPKAPVDLPAKPNQEAVAEVRGHLQRLATLQPIELFFRPEAQALWKEFYLKWKAATWSELTTAAIKRIPAYIVKLSMVYAAFEGTSLITAEQLHAAIKVGQYGTKCADRLMSRHRQQGVQSKCEARVLAALRDQPLPAWKIHRAISGDYSAEELARALRALQAAGAIVVTGTTPRHEPLYGRRNHAREV